MEALTFLIVLCGIFVGWGIGANDAANCLGTSVGAGLLNYKKAAWIVGILVFIGAAVQGKATMKTMGSGIVDATLLTDVSIIAILLSAALLVLVFTIFSLPISTTQAVIGGIAGISVMLHASANWAMVGKIFILGFGTTLMAAVIGFIIYKAYYKLLSGRSFLVVERVLGWAVLLSGAFLAYSLGANNIGNAMGLVVGKEIMTALIAGVIGGLAISIGSVTLGSRVMKTIGNDITPLNAPMAFAAQASAGISVYILTIFGIPTSITFGIVGAVAGVGMVQGVSSVEKRTVRNIMLGWFATPLIGAVAAPLIFLLLKIII